MQLVIEITDRQQIAHVGIGFLLQRFDRFIVLLVRGNADNIPFRIPESCQASTEDAAGVNAVGAVQEFDFLSGNMAVYDHTPAPVIRGPVQPDRQAVGIELAGGFAVQAEIPHPHGASSDVFLLEAGMRRDQLAVIENIVADQAVQEFSNLRLKFISLRVHFRNGQIDAMG